MPTYEYECGKCRKRFTLFQWMTDKPVSRCPKCRSGRTRRLIGSGGGLIFKGSGFYITDYKNKKKTTGEAGAGGSAPDKTGKPDSPKKPDKPEKAKKP